MQVKKNCDHEAGFRTCYAKLPTFRGRCAILPMCRILKIVLDLHV